MDENKTYIKNIVQLASLALQGKKADTVMMIKRLVNNTKNEFPELSQKLSKLLEEHDASQLNMRGGAVASIPVDLDSRLELVRIEYPPKLEFEPIWSKTLQKQFNLIIMERKKENILLKEGLLPTRSVLFTGAPGVGKTLAAKWLARNLNLPLLTVDLSAIMSSFLGRTGNNIRHVLDYAKSLRCVLLLDEVDALAKKRDDAVEIGELKRLVTVILQEIENWPASGLLIAATNHPQLLDPAVWRRFDAHIEFSMPNDDDLYRAIILYMNNDKLIKSTWVNVLTVVLRNSSYSDIERILSKIRRESVIEGKDLEEMLLSFINEKTIDMHRNDKILLAKRLIKAGISQRRSSEITGISRDTIRRLLIKQ